MRVFVVGVLGLVLSSCQSADERKLQDMVERKVAQTNFQIARLSKPYIFRAMGDARMACLTVSLKNQWGELQPDQRLIAWYIPRTDSWHTDNFQPANDGLSCEQFVDPARQAAQRAAVARSRSEGMDRIVNQMRQDAVRQEQEQARQDQIQNDAYNASQRSAGEASAARSRADEAEYQRLQQASDAVLQRSLENGPSKQ